MDDDAAVRLRLSYSTPTKGKATRASFPPPLSLPPPPLPGEPSPGGLAPDLAQRAHNRLFGLALSKKQAIIVEMRTSRVHYPPLSCFRSLAGRAPFDFFCC